MPRRNAYVAPLLSLGVLWGVLYGLLAIENPGSREQLELGRKIFQQGTTRAGAEIPACARCHGRAGSGLREGDLVAPDIRGPTLFSLRREGASPKYDRSSWRRAVRQGRAPDGRTFGITMPRFDLQAKEEEALYQFVRRLGAEPDPGLSDGEIRLTTSLPLSGNTRRIGEAVQSTIEGVFTEVNLRGGIFGRKLALKVWDCLAAEPAAPERDRNFFARVSGLSGALGCSELSDPDGPLPWIGPLGFAPPTEGSPRMETRFDLLPGFDVQAQGAVEHLSRTFPVHLNRKPKIAVIAAAGVEGRSWIGGARRETARRELGELQVFTMESGRSPAGILPEIFRARPDAVLYWGPLDGLRALRASSPRGTRIYAPWVLGAVNSVGNTYWTSVTYSGAEGREVQAGLTHWLRERKLASDELGFRSHAWAAARTLVEALSRSGATPSRDRLITELESFRDFKVGILPPLSFGKSRRIGVLRVQILKSGKSRALESASEWLSIQP